MRKRDQQAEGRQGLYLDEVQVVRDGAGANDKRLKRGTRAQNDGQGGLAFHLFAQRDRHEDGWNARTPPGEGDVGCPGAALGRVPLRLYLEDDPQRRWIADVEDLVCMNRHRREVPLRGVGLPRARICRHERCERRAKPAEELRRSQERLRKIFV